MENIDLCIWGCRDGFEVIHSENESWKNYLIANSLDLDGKMQKLINSLDEFYMLNKNNGNQVISYVVPSIDKGFRDTYMVISLICKQNISYGSKLFDVLHKIWEIYKRDNFKGKHLTSNEFDITEIKSFINSINSDPLNKFYQLANCTIKIDDLNLFKNELGRFKGDAVYLINLNTEQAGINKLPPSIKLLTDLISKGVPLPEIDEFRVLLKQKQNFDRAKDLFKRFQSNLTQQEIIDFSRWSSDITNGLDLKKLIDLVSKHALSEEEKAFIQHHDKNNTPAFLSLTANQIELLRKKITITGEIDITLIEQIKKAIDDAERSNWADNPKEWEDLMLSKPGIKDKLDRKYIDNLIYWRKQFNEKEEKNTKAELEHWYETLKNSKPDTISKNLEDWKVKITSLSHRILSLQNTDFSHKLTSSKEYIYISSKEWEPKIRKPNFKIIIPIIVVGLLVGLYFLNKERNAEKVDPAKLDADNDGILDEIDQDKNTVWLADTTKYQVRKFVTANGIIDAAKTKKLCDCWEFPDTNDRKILKCKDNLNWFVVNGKLYEFRSNGPADGKFYKSDTEFVKSGDDDEIEKEHKKLFPDFYNTGPTVEDPTVEEVPEDVDLNKKVTISYNGKKYKIKQGVLTKEGIYFNNSNYRFLNNKWELQSNPPNGTWSNPRDGDINYLLNKIAKEITEKKDVVKKEEEKKPEAKKEVKEKDDKKVDDSPGNSTLEDLYWIELSEKTENQLLAKESDIRLALRDPQKAPKSDAGIAARKAVKKKLRIN